MHNHDLELKTYPTRLETINEIGILEKPYDDFFFNSCQLAASICQTPRAFMCVLSENKQNYLATVGKKIAESQLPPEKVFCEVTLVSDEGFYIYNADKSNPLPNDHPFLLDDLKFYAGFRISAPNGVPIATICTLHHDHHSINELQIEQMKWLAKSIEEKIYFIEQLNKQKESLDELNDLYEFAPCGYHSLNADGNIVKINKTELKWLGYAEHEVLGKHVSFIFDEKEKEKIQDSLMLIKKFGTVNQTVFMLKSKNGETKPVSLSATAIKNKNGKFLRTRSTLHDISLRMEFEAMLKDKNRELEKTNDALNHLNAEKNQFFGMAVHDLKNPISAISSLVKLINLEFPSLDDGLKTYLNHIESSANKVMTLVKSLLDINRIEQTGMKPNLSLVNVYELVERCVESYQSHINQKMIVIKNEISNEKLQIQTDNIFFQQIADNLISNAIKFSPQNKMIFINAFVEDNLFVFYVKDEGPGIKQEEIGKLFTKFSRLSNRPTAGETSSGLGLAIVKDFTERLGGTVECESTSGLGAKFIVKLPIN
ncbi:MAG: PAS domain-containing sensor histidine kinase [Cytophagales bacterium]